MTPSELEILKTELTTDPLARGYVAMKHHKAAESFQDRDRTTANDTTTGGEVASAIVRADLAGLVAADKTYLQLLVSAATLQLKGPASAVKDELKTLFPAGSATRANLVSLFKRPGTRAEELGIPQPTASDIADALRG